MKKYLLKNLFHLKASFLVFMILKISAIWDLSHSHYCQLMYRKTNHYVINYDIQAYKIGSVLLNM